MNGAARARQTLQRRARRAGRPGDVRDGRVYGVRVRGGGGLGARTGGAAKVGPDHPGRAAKVGPDQQVVTR